MQEMLNSTCTTALFLQCAKQKKTLLFLLKRAASATPSSLAACGAIHKMPIVVAAVHLPVREAEPAGMVRTAEGALAPSLMDVPNATSTASTSVGTAAIPSASRASHSSSALHEAKCLLAAADARGSIAKEACTMGRAKRAAPRLRSGRHQRG